MPKPPARQLLTYFASYDPYVSNLTLALRDLVLEEAPVAIEVIFEIEAQASPRPSLHLTSDNGREHGDSPQSKFDETIWE